MVSPQLGRTIFRIAFYITLVSAVLMFFLEPGSAEFVVTEITLLIGLIFIVLIALLVRQFSR
jgi:NADH:ubiquinone oxidoreductase subunit H